MKKRKEPVERKERKGDITEKSARKKMKTPNKQQWDGGNQQIEKNVI